uniref:Uncharacterized protein n=1 Tax=viral metagenome TaxID=1070528 RepID=A0A6M3LKM6_9ZZZZ
MAQSFYLFNNQLQFTFSGRGLYLRIDNCLATVASLRAPFLYREDEIDEIVVSLKKLAKGGE